MQYESYVIYTGKRIGHDFAPPTMVNMVFSPRRAHNGDHDDKNERTDEYEDGYNDYTKGVGKEQESWEGEMGMPWLWER